VTEKTVRESRQRAPNLYKLFKNILLAAHFVTKIFVCGAFHVKNNPAKVILSQCLILSTFSFIVKNYSISNPQ